MSALVHAHRFDSLPEDRAARWRRYPGSGAAPGQSFPELLGIEVVEVRADYAALRLPFRRELLQPAGVVHGGVLASLLDSVVVPAIGSGYDDRRAFSTVDLTIQFLGAVTDQDLVAEGWVRQRGRSIAFFQAEVRTEPEGRLVALGTTTFKVSAPGSPG